MFEPHLIILSLFGGIIPAAIWLFFWLREDSKHPEPSGYILLTFVYGMLSVPVALIAQLLINQYLLGTFTLNEAVFQLPILGVTSIIVLALSEELTKYLAAYFGGLKRRIDDEPLDDMIYMITAALGFAAVENALFLLGPVLDGNTELAIITGNMRFIGATLLHVATSAIIGVFIAFSHFKLQEVKKRYLFSGIILATALHTAFNLFIIKKTDAIFIAFSGVWLITVVIIFLFEKLKKIHLEKIEP